MKKLIFLIAISFNILAATHYVSKTGSNIYPYASWETAATNIIDGIGSNADLVLVADGIYYPSEEIYIASEMTVKSVNGAKKTIIDGSGLHRVFHLAGNTNIIVDGFTITNGFIDGMIGRGGGVICHKGTIQYCIISGNKAGGTDYSGSQGLI